MSWTRKQTRHKVQLELGTSPPLRSSCFLLGADSISNHCLPYGSCLNTFSRSVKTGSPSRRLFPRPMLFSMPTHNPRGIGGISSGQDKKVILVKAAVEAHQIDSSPPIQHNGTVSAIRHCLYYRRSTNVIPRPGSLAWVHQISNQSTSWAQSMPLLLIWQSHWRALLGLLVSKKASLMLSNIPYAPSICPVYNRAKSDEVVYRQYTKDKKRPLPVVDAARDYLFDLTNDHPEAVEAPFLRCRATQLCQAFLYFLSMC